MGQGLATVVTLISSMVLARLLTQAELATYRQTLLAYNFAAPVLSLGLSSGLYYFLPNEELRGRAIVVEGLMAMVIMGLIYSIFIAVGGNLLLAKRFSNPEIAKTLIYLVPYPLLTLPAGLLSAVLVVKGKVRQLSVFNVLSNLALGVSVLGACLVWHDPRWLIIAYVLVSLVNGFVAITLMLRAVPTGDWRPQLPHLMTMIAYSLPLALASMLGSIALQLDKVIVSSLRPPEEFAIYSIGAVELPLVGIITGAISAVILADMAGLCKNGQKVEAMALFRKGAVLSAMIMFPVTAFLMVYAREFIVLLFSQKYLDSVGIFKIYLGVLPIRIVMYGAALMALNMTRVVLFRSILDLAINAVLSIILVFSLGPYGAALATLIMLYVWCVPFNLHMIGKGFNCRWWETLPFYELIKVALISVASGWLALVSRDLVSNGQPLILLSVGFCIFVPFYVLLSWKLLDDFRQLLRQVVHLRGA